MNRTKTALVDLLQEIDTWNIELSKDIEPFEADAIYEFTMRQAREAVKLDRYDEMRAALQAVADWHDQPEDKAPREWADVVRQVQAALAEPVKTPR